MSHPSHELTDATVMMNNEPTCTLHRVWQSFPLCGCDLRNALQTLLVEIEAETGVIAADDLRDEPGYDLDSVEVGVTCSVDASS